MYRAKYAHLTESTVKSDSHEGGDFIQENALGRVMPFLKRGKIFSNEIFADAVRKCEQNQVSKRKRSEMKTENLRKRPKYENEVQAVAALILNKNENPAIIEGLGDLHEDVLKITQIGNENYEVFFHKRIIAVSTGSIKLKPAFITRQACSDYENIENQSKNLISERILILVSQIDFETFEEKQYFENKARKKSVTKNELLEIHSDLEQMLVVNENS